MSGPGPGGPPEGPPEDPAPVRIGAIRGGPVSEEEAAAIVAAIEMAWPRPQPGGEPQSDPARWRFSGRWWRKPVPLRRDRPSWS